MRNNIHGYLLRGVSPSEDQDLKLITASLMTRAAQHRGTAQRLDAKLLALLCNSNTSTHTLWKQTAYNDNSLNLIQPPILLH